jgi:outer membrane receptor protein involved in Fe transport
MRVKRAIWRIALFCAVTSPTLFGQQARSGAAVPESELAKLDLKELMNLEITSVSRRAEPLSGAAASIFVITGDEIRRSGATNLPEALRLAPNLDVVEVNAGLERVRQDARTQYVPVVVLTTSTEQDDMVAAGDLHANSYVRKPIDFDTSVEAARQLGLYWGAHEPIPVTP